MKKFRNQFEDRLYKWVLKLVKYIDNLPKSLVSDVMGKQLLRSGTSILANYVEAKSASSKKEYINFFHYSLKSANESIVWLRLLHDTGKISADEFELLHNELAEVAKIIASSIITMKKDK